MAKSKSPHVVGKMTEDLKQKTEVDNASEELAPVGPDKDVELTHVVKKDPEVKVEPVEVEKVDPPAEDSAVDVISKPEAELLIRKFINKKKEDTLPLDETIKEVKDRNKELQKQRDKRKQQPMRIIRNLRQYDPKGKKTCGRCAQRVLIETMDTKKELCEVCAS